MKLLLSSLQLASLCAIMSWSASSQLVVTQSEDVTVEEGHTANISCCWTNRNERMTVKWMTNKHEVKSEIIKLMSCSFLIIENITKAREGTYFCHVNVEIPALMKVSGNGSALTVKSINKTNRNINSGDGSNASNASVFTVIGLAVGASILLVTLIYFCCRRRKRVQAARVIYEVPHFDSETQEMDKDSTGSRDSSQWCQVPLYDSVDYFVHTEAKKSG